jgi:hypothetical protein
VGVVFGGSRLWWELSLVGVAFGNSLILLQFSLEYHETRGHLKRLVLNVDFETVTMTTKSTFKTHRF